MPSFSQRNGHRPLQKAIQREQIDEDLKNRLWTALCQALWNRWVSGAAAISQSGAVDAVEGVARLCWIDHLKKPLDEIPSFKGRYNHDLSCYRAIRDHFFTGPWWQAYDLLEFLFTWTPDDWKPLLKNLVNVCLEEENAAYRLVGNEIVEITDDHEIEAIETALDVAIRGCRVHLATALEKLSDREQPDYRNSIKESISAVETACRLVARDPRATLGACINKIKGKGFMHSALERALVQLYGYASDEKGIRHALAADTPTPTYSDAKFMLVTCAAFVNFIWTRAAEQNITISD